MLAVRLFRSGLIASCLFALGHFLGFLEAARAARHDPAMAGLTRAMREHRTNVAGFQPSILDFREYFSLNFSILLLGSAVLGFVAISMAPHPPAVVRRMSAVYVVTMLMLLGTSVYFSVFQGMVSCAVIAALFGLAWRLA